MQIKLSELAEKINCILKGDDCIIENVADITQAVKGEIVFVGSAKYLAELTNTQASAVILKQNLVKQCHLPILYTDNPRLAFAKAATLLNLPAKSVALVDKSAHISVHCELSKTTTIEALSVIKSGATIGENTSIGAGSIIGNNVKIGDNTTIYANVSIYANAEIGNNCIIHSGAVIGADGFGFVKDKNNYLKVPQLGRVIIGNHVEIGANTSIDRGALLDTIISNGVKLDNQIQIGHNVNIGEHSVISACSCIAGSVKIGRFCLFGGSVGIRDNVEICDHVIITGRTLVSHSITKSGSYSSSTPMDKTENWRKNAVRFRQLDKMSKRLIKLEREKK